MSVRIRMKKMGRPHRPFFRVCAMDIRAPRDGKVIATPPARIDSAYEHPEKTPGHYEIVLQTWKYLNYRKNKEGEFTESKFIDISNVVVYDIK